MATVSKGVFAMEEKSRYYPDQFNWWELPESCDRCRQQLHMKSGQEVPFCPNCAIDIRNAKRGREDLAAAKARLTLQHLIVEKKRRSPNDDDDSGPNGVFILGMPL